MKVQFNINLPETGRQKNITDKRQACPKKYYKY